MHAALGLLALAAAWSGLFWHVFAGLLPIWLNDPSYGHSGAVALAIIGFVAYRANKYPVGDPTPTQAGMAFFLAAVAMLVATLLGSSFAAMAAIIFTGRAALLFVGGRSFAGRLTFPLILVVFLFPMPYTWTSYAALWLQDIVSQFAESILSLFVVCTRTGHTIRIAGVDQSLVVAEECSGLRQILAFVACAAVLGALIHPRTVAHRLALILASVPVAVTANVLRVVLMNMSAVWFGTNWMSTWMHDVPALFSLPVGIGLFFFADTLLFGVCGTPPRPPAPEAGPPTPSIEVRRRLLLAAAVTAGLAAANGLLQWHLWSSPQTYTDLSAPLSNTPLRLGEPSSGWVGQDLVRQREALLPKLTFQVDEVLLRGYESTSAPVGAQLYMVYSRTGEDRHHHPEICVREVSGAPEDVSARAKVPLDAPERQAQRFRFLTRTGQSTAIYYWHYRLPPVPGRRTILQELHQRLAGTAPSITVMVTMNGESRPALELAEKTLLPAVDRAVRAAIPNGTTVGSNRLPIPLVRD